MTSKDTPIHPPFSTGIWSRAPDHIQPSMDMEITSSPESAQVYCELNFPYSRYSCLLYMLLPDSIAKEELLMYNSQEAWLECVYKSYILTLQIKEKRRKGKERKGKERKGKERKGKERKGKERKGKERKGKHCTPTIP